MSNVGAQCSHLQSGELWIWTHSEYILYRLLCYLQQLTHLTPSNWVLCHCLTVSIFMPAFNAIQRKGCHCYSVAEGHMVSCVPCCVQWAMQDVSTCFCVSLCTCTTVGALSLAVLMLLWQLLSVTTIQYIQLLLDSSPNRQTGFLSEGECAQQCTVYIMIEYLLLPRHIHVQTP